MKKLCFIALLIIISACSKEQVEISYKPTDVLENSNKEQLAEASPNLNHVFMSCKAHQ